MNWVNALWKHGLLEKVPGKRGVAMLKCRLMLMQDHPTQTKWYDNYMTFDVSPIESVVFPGLVSRKWLKGLVRDGFTGYDLPDRRSGTNETT